MVKTKTQLLLYLDLFIIYALTWPDFRKMFITTEKGTFKKEKMKDEHFDVARTKKVCRMWLGRRKWAECGSDEKMRWLALYSTLRWRRDSDLDSSTINILSTNMKSNDKVSARFRRRRAQHENEMKSNHKYQINIKSN